jgi:hypothetical protein
MTELIVAFRSFVNAPKIVGYFCEGKCCHIVTGTGRNTYIHPVGTMYGFWTWNLAVNRETKGFKGLQIYYDLLLQFVHPNSRNISVGVVIGLWAEWPKNSCSIPEQGNRNSFSTKYSYVFWGLTIFLLDGCRGLWGWETDDSPPLSAQCKNGWSCTSLPPMLSCHAQGELCFLIIWPYDEGLYDPSLQNRTYETLVTRHSVSTYCYTYLYFLFTVYA